MLATTDADEAEDADADADEEVRSLAGMLLTAAPALFDDPVARAFMEQAQRFSVTLFRVVRQRPERGLSDADRKMLSDGSNASWAALGPLLARLRPGEATVLGEDATR